MVKSTRGSETKQKILGGAKSILLKEGIGSLTVDSLCERVGVSKGAFFHHFKSRDELLLGLLESLTGEQAKHYGSISCEDKQAFGKGLRSYIRTTLHQTGAAKESARAICRCLMEMLFTNPDLLKKAGLVPGYYEPLLSDEIRQGLSRNQALLLLLACEGLWFDQSLGIHGIKKEQVGEVIDLLVELTTKTIIF